MRRLPALLLAALLAAGPAAAQTVSADVEPPDGTAIGGTFQDGTATAPDPEAGPAAEGALADILARQEALAQSGRDPGALPGTDVGDRDAEMWGAIRHDEADVTTVVRTPAATTLIQTGGIGWQEFRAGALSLWGAVALAATAGLLALFYAIRGRIRIEGPRTGRRILRFTAVERFGHWLLGGSFILLAITGFLVLFGRAAIIPWLGHEAYAPIAQASKWVHNNVSWAFMLGLVIAFVAWVRHNIPSRVDLAWIRQGGGFIGSGHPAAHKFNAGQKAIFWAVIIGGTSISASGLSLLFPFELPMFAKTFGLMNATGIPGLLGMPLPTDLAPQEEMQLAQAWHTIVAFLLSAVAIAHIYIGSIGMEGAYDAMGSGTVDETWAREHHSLWVEELEAEGRTPHAPHAAAHPAE